MVDLLCKLDVLLEDGEDLEEGVLSLFAVVTRHISYSTSEDRRPYRMDFT